MSKIKGLLTIIAAVSAWQPMPARAQETVVDPAATIVGEWEGQESGQTGTFVFHKDEKLTVIDPNGRFDHFTYSIRVEKLGVILAMVRYENKRESAVDFVTENIIRLRDVQNQKPDQTGTHLILKRRAMAK